MFTKIQKRRSYQLNRWFWLALGVLAILVFFTQASPATYAQSETITVDMAVYGGAPTYRASGFIYGIAQDGSQPPDALLTDINTKFLRAGGAQIGCPNGGWVNGQYAARWESVKAYYNRAQNIGATLLLLPHDLWGADAVCNVPRWPGDNGDWTEYTNFMNQVISDAIANGMTGPDVRWELWNEPDLTSFWGGTQAQYLEMWKRGYQMVRAAIPNAVIEGPSFSAYPNSSNSWWTNYLDYVKANDVVPDYMAWHDEWGGNDPVGDANNMNAMLSARNISVTGYDINEYGTSSEQNPGHSAWFIARLERANGGVDGLRGNWGMASGLYAGMGDLVTSSWEPLGQWWIYKRYADQTGLRTKVTAGAQIDAIAFQDSTTNKSIIVVGNKGGTTGVVNVVINNIPAYLQNNGTTQVLLEKMPEGTTYVSAPTVVSNSSLPVSGNSLTVAINWSNAKDGYAITLTPGNGSQQQQYEAENGGWGGGASVATDHSGYTGSGFVAFVTEVGAYNTFTVNAASAGNYPVTLRYSAGPNGPTTDRSMSIYVNGTDVAQTILPRTSTWDVWATKTETLPLNAGSNTIRYQYDSSDTGWINLDHIVIGSGGGPTPTPTLTPTPTATPDGSFPVPGTYYRLIARHSGKVADVSGASTADGGNVIQWPTNGEANQQWRFESVGNGYYNVINRNSGKCLDVEGISTADGANIYQWTCLGGANQHWQLVDVGGSYYELRAQHSGKCLDVEGISTANGANVHQWTCLGGANQQWSITP